MSDTERDLVFKCWIHRVTSFLSCSYLLPRMYVKHTNHMFRHIFQPNCSERRQLKFLGFLSSVSRCANVRRKSGSFGNKTSEQLLRKHGVLYGKPCSAVGTVTGLWAENPQHSLLGVLLSAIGLVLLQSVQAISEFTKHPIHCAEGPLSTQIQRMVHDVHY